MSRRRVAIKREIAPDLKYNSKFVARFINKIMLKGKKSLAEKIFYQSLDIATEKLGEKDVLKILDKVLNNVKPLLEVKSRRIGGATYQIPVEVNPNRGISLAMRWIINFARERKGQPMWKALATELIDAYNNTGSAVKKREDTHKMAEANKAFAHYKW